MIFWKRYLVHFGWSYIGVMFEGKQRQCCEKGSAFAHRVKGIKWKMEIKGLPEYSPPDDRSVFDACKICALASLATILYAELTKTQCLEVFFPHFR